MPADDPHHAQRVHHRRDRVDRRGQRRLACRSTRKSRRFRIRTRKIPRPRPRPASAWRPEVPLQRGEELPVVPRLRACARASRRAPRSRASPPATRWRRRRRRRGCAARRAARAATRARRCRAPRAKTLSRPAGRRRRRAAPPRVASRRRSWPSTPPPPPRACARCPRPPRTRARPSSPPTRSDVVEEADASPAVAPRGARARRRAPRARELGRDRGGEHGGAERRRGDAEALFFAPSPTLGVTFSFGGGERASRSSPALAAAFPRRLRAAAFGVRPVAVRASRGTKTCLMSCSSASSDGPELASAPEVHAGLHVAGAAQNLRRRILDEVRRRRRRRARGAASPRRRQAAARGPRPPIDPESRRSVPRACRELAATITRRLRDETGLRRLAFHPSALSRRLPRSVPIITGEGSGPSPSANAATSSRGFSGAREDASTASVARSPFCSGSPPPSSGASTVASAFSFPLELCSNGVDRVPAGASPRAFGSTYTRSAFFPRACSVGGGGARKHGGEPARAVDRGGPAASRVPLGRNSSGKPRTQQRTSHDASARRPRLVVVRHALGACATSHPGRRGPSPLATGRAYRRV